MHSASWTLSSSSFVHTSFSEIREYDTEIFRNEVLITLVRSLPSNSIPDPGNCSGRALHDIVVLVGHIYMYMTVVLVTQHLHDIVVLVGHIYVTVVFGRPHLNVLGSDLAMSVYVRSCLKSAECFVMTSLNCASSPARTASVISR